MIDASGYNAYVLCKLKYPTKYSLKVSRRLSIEELGKQLIFENCKSRITIFSNNGFAHVSRSILKTFQCVGINIADYKTAKESFTERVNYRDICSHCAFGSNTTKYRIKCFRCNI